MERVTTDWESVRIRKSVAPPPTAGTELIGTQSAARLDRLQRMERLYDTAIVQIQAILEIGHGVRPEASSLVSMEINTRSTAQCGRRLIARKRPGFSILTDGDTCGGENPGNPAPRRHHHEEGDLKARNGNHPSRAVLLAS
jgi:hypothetical protein